MAWLVKAGYKATPTGAGIASNGVNIGLMQCREILCNVESASDDDWLKKRVPGNINARNEKSWDRLSDSLGNGHCDNFTEHPTNIKKVGSIRDDYVNLQGMKNNARNIKDPKMYFRLDGGCDQDQCDAGVYILP